MESTQEIKNRQKLVLIFGFSFFVVILVFGMWISDPNRGKLSPLEMQQAKAEEVVKSYKTNSSVSAHETWIAKSEKEMSAFQQYNRDLSNQVAQLKKKLASLEKSKRKPEGIRLATSNFPNDQFNPATSILPGTSSNKRLPPPPSDAALLLKVANNSLPPAPSQNPGRGGFTKKNTQQINTIQVINLTNNSVKKGKKNVSHYIPTGSFSTAVLMSGLDAPTGGLAQKQPMPVVLRLKDDGQMPNYFKSEVSNCHVTGAGYGDLSAERAYIRLETLSCVLINGDVVENSVSGYVTGEDGKAGLRGTVVSKQGAMIAKAALAGVFSGIGSAVAQTHQKIAANPLGNVASYDPKKIGETGLATGTSNAMEKIADFWMARANETYPIIEVDAHRIGEIIFTKGVDFGQDLIGKIGRGDGYE